MPTLGGAYVSVGYDPVGGDDTIPRYAAGAGMHVLAVEECLTSLLFPFVTNLYGYDTGIALTNTSGANGTCMVEWSGTNAPADDGMVEVMAESTATFGVSMMAPEFQGYADITCDYTGGQGFAFITIGFGSMGGPTAAHGYLVADDLRDSD